MHIIESHKGDHTSYPSSSVSANPARTSSNSSGSNNAGTNAPSAQQHHVRSPSTSRLTRPSNARKASEVDMLDGVVDMDAFEQILALDDGDTTKEFSKTLVTAWCDQAEVAVEEMEHYLRVHDIVSSASKAHYLKGSSASLGLVQVSKTCLSIYHLHFPPSLAQFRNMSYTSNYSPTGSSASDSTRSSSSSSSDSGSSRYHMRDHSESVSPVVSPVLEGKAFNFEADKFERAAVLLQKLKTEVKQASDWLSKYYEESDKYANVRAYNSL